jgi:hypothetical protein
MRQCCKVMVNNSLIQPRGLFVRHRRPFPLNAAIVRPRSTAAAAVADTQARLSRESQTNSRIPAAAARSRSAISHDHHLATALGASSSSKKGRPAWERPLTFYAAVRAATSITRRRPRAAGLPPRLRLQAAPAAAARLPPDPRRVRSEVRSAHPETRAHHGAPAVGPY